MDDLERNKSVVREFYDLAFNQKNPQEAAAKYLGSTYKQHYPTAAEGRDAFVDFVKGFTLSFPELKVQFEKIVAEGDLVSLFSHITMKPGDQPLVVFDLFRVENGKLVEHWGFDFPVVQKKATGSSSP